MKETRLCSMSGIVFIGFGLTLLNSWILFEETIVDRSTLHQFMPFYRVGAPCAWDAAAVLAIVAGCLWIWRRRKAAQK